LTPSPGPGSIELMVRLNSLLIRLAIIMAKTCSTTKVNSKWQNFRNLPKYIPAKISSHAVLASYLQANS